MEKILCIRRLRIWRLFVIFTMLLTGSMLVTLYILTISCCAGLHGQDLVNPERPARVILVKDGEEDETRYQQVLDELEDNPNFPQIRRKPLLDEENHKYLISEHDTHPHKSHTRRHRTTDSSETNDYDSPIVIRYDDDGDEDTDLTYQDYDSNTNRKNRTRKTKGNKINQKSSRKLPGAIIIGVKKGGTRALLEFLRIHPDVRAPGPEPHFFDRNFEKGLEWYRRQMPPTLDGHMTIEKTPSYFVTKGVPGRIYNMSKNIKFIIVVRDPVTRAISDYTQAQAKRTNISSFESMAFEDNSTGLVDTSWGAIRIGVYAKHLERWLQYFPLSQMHFVSGEKLITDPAGEIGKVQDFLRLSRRITDKNFILNTAKGFPCLLRPDGNPKKPHCLGKTKGREHPKIDPKVLQRLQDFFRPFNQKFYQMVGQDFGWS